MRLLLSLIIILNICSCATTPPREEPIGGAEQKAETPPPEIQLEELTVLESRSNNPQFPGTLRIQLEDNELIILTATIKNLTGKPVTFINHPDHRGFSVHAADRKKDEALGGLLVSYVRPTLDRLKKIMPNEAITFNESFKIERRDHRTVFISDPVGGLLYEDHGMLIRDKDLVASFSYGWYPDYLPAGMTENSRRFVKTEINLHALFKTPAM